MMKKQRPTAAWSAIALRRGRILLSTLFAFSSFMAIVLLMGFAHVFRTLHEIDSLAFTGYDYDNGFGTVNIMGSARCQ